MESDQEKFSIHVEGRTIICDKAVLREGSEYFRAMFDSNMIESRANETTLRDQSYEVIKTLVDSMKSGELVITSNIEELVEGATMLQIESAIISCMAYLERTLDDSNCLSLLKFADTFGLDKVYNLSKRHSLYYFNEVIKHEEFLNLTQQELIDYLSEKYLNVETELNILDAIDLWVNSNLANGKVSNLAAILECFHPEDLMEGEWEEAIKKPIFADSEAGKQWLETNTKPVSTTGEQDMMYIENLTLVENKVDLASRTEMEIINSEDGGVDIKPLHKLSSLDTSTPAEEITSTMESNNNNNNSNSSNSDNNSKSYQCTMCISKFTRKDNLKRHLKTHSSDFIFCPVCSRYFNSKADMEIHRATHLKQLCNRCGSVFNKKSNLDEHIKSVHEGTKYKCLVSGCNRSFSRTIFLQAHMNVHLGAKPFKCEKCLRSFHHRYSCKRHESICGTTQKFVCGKCKKCFVSKDGLKEHESSVHKHIVFGCQCGRTFAWRSGLSRHMSKCKKDLATDCFDSI